MSTEEVKESKGGTGGADGEPEEDYVVEKILDRRVIKGKTQYFLKWKGYPDSDNTWEPIEHLECPELISAFEEQYKARGASKRRAVAPTPKEEPKKKEPKIGGQVGFDRGLKPDKILGATDASGEVYFLMKWKDTEATDLVPAKEANVKCPQLVIQFYEKRLTWHEDPATQAKSAQEGEAKA